MNPYSPFVWVNCKLPNFFNTQRPHSKSTHCVAMWPTLKVVRHAKFLAPYLAHGRHSLNTTYNFMNMEC